VTEPLAVNVLDAGLENLLRLGAGGMASRMTSTKPKRSGFVFLKKSEELDMEREKLARDIFVAMAEGTNPTREVPKPLLVKTAKLAFRAADAFLAEMAEQAKQAEGD
jgi:hypothetical protein